jgi:LuxR family transcriptional regulator, maltose regulon positive regulatory protein
MSVELHENRPATTWRSPVAAPGSVERRRLDHFFAGAGGRLVRVIAPPGYGKSSLVARWVSTDDRTVRWVDLDRSDDDPVTLFDTLRRALSDIFVVALPSAVHARADEPFVKALEDGLMSSDPPSPFVLVLDDVHRVRSLGGHRLIQTLVEQLPPESTVVMAGRGYHDHGTIARLRLAPGVVDIAVDDLALEISESHKVLDAMGVDADTPEVAELLRDLEGWPAGVRLAGQVLRSGTPLGHIKDHVSLVDYLRGEWIGQLGEDDRTFLREIACLQRFTGEQCDEVLERTGSGELLRRLHRDQVIVFALDQRDERFRMHGLLTRWLSAELRSADPRRWKRIHLNAAHDLERRGEIDRAVEHARAAGDLDALEAIVSVHGGRYFTIGRDATVEKWLEAFPPDHVLHSPDLNGLQCIKALHRGDELRALEWLRVLDKTVATGGGRVDAAARWSADVLHAALDERAAAELIPKVAAAREHLAGSPHWSGLASWVHGALSFLNGDIDGSRDALRAGVFEAELLGSQLVIGHCLATMSILDDCMGNQRSAEANAHGARQAIESSGGELLPPTAPAMAVTALQHARHGDNEAAVLAVAAARQALTGFASIAPWFNVITRLALIRAALRLDDRATARELVQELRYHARFEPLPADSSAPSAMACAHELFAQVESMHVPATGTPALTETELRVLRLLPTNLTLDDIATQHFVSRNTVKTHVASIYRKLDVNRRADAVDHARQAGLLPDTRPI